jgi:APA family basic amino acid/polyamine antiporter
VKDRPDQQLVSTGPAAALVISNMIGIGIFTSLGFQLEAFTNKNGSSQLAHGGVFPIMMLWLVGGLLALCGALCYAELATALPRSGGEYNFLSRIYHPAVGFCTGLTSVTIGFAAPIAMSALTFGHYFCRTFPAVAELSPHMDVILSLILVSLATLAHLRSVRFSGGVQAMTTALTVLLILAFVVCGFSKAAAQPVTFVPQGGDLSLIGSSAFGSSLIWVMYSYSGWNAASYIAGEVRNPGKSLPRALVLGTLSVIVLYATITAAFLYTTPLTLLAGKLEVADVAGGHIFGPTGARIGNALICVGLVANISGMMWIGSRVSQAIGSNYRILSPLARTSPRGVPYFAQLLQFVITATLVFFDPANIVTYVESVLFFWSLLAVLGVIVLRVREPQLARPYRTFGYPVTPLLFAVVAVFILGQTYIRHPHPTLIGAFTVLAGLPIYWYATRAGREGSSLRGTLPGQIL